MAIPNRIRKQVFERDGHKCQICSSTKNLEIDHKQASSRGGDNELNNLWVLCGACNHIKNRFPLEKLIERYQNPFAQARVKLGLSMEQLKTLSKVDNQTIIKIETGLPVSLTSIERVCDVLGVNWELHITKLRWNNKYSITCFQGNQDAD